ncbi:MAG: TetR/AcrR family transcriptional regulator [Hyphomicrobiales bacterium]
MATEKTRQKIVDALLAIAAEKRWEEIGLPEIAARSGVSLSALRGAFDSKLDILAAFAARIDEAVLDNLDEDMAEETARERLFDVIMGRIEALTPHKAALKSIMRGIARDPLFAAAWGRVALRSQGWMLAGAGISTTGLRGTLRTQGLMLAWARVFRVWIEDDEPDIARTMAALDRTLTDGERWLKRADKAICAARPFVRLCKRVASRRSRRSAGPDEAPPAETAPAA